MRLLEARGRGGVRALVRSRRAADQLGALGLADGVDVRLVDYHDSAALAEALGGCRSVVHLVGIIKESPGNGYCDAHQRSCAALAAAAARSGLIRVVYLSILGATVDSANACLASKAAAERILMEGPVPATVIRLPMVLGEDDYAARALAGRARRGWNLVLRGASLEQPIYAGDVVAAVLGVLAAEDPPRSCDLAGPESLSRASLIRRAARVLGRRTRVVSLPLGLGLVVAWLLETFSASPPVTRAMLGVLDHDDCIDPEPAVAALGLRLTSLDETLRRCLGAPEPTR
jgi:NADH dehydrogenase